MHKIQGELGENIKFSSQIEENFSNVRQEIDRLKHYEEKCNELELEISENYEKLKLIPEYENRIDIISGEYDKMNLLYNELM